MSTELHDPVCATDRNIQAIFDHQKEEQESQTLLEKAACKVSAYAGTVQFIILHVIFFAFWVGINLSPFAFDEYPFLLLITFVSLESILLSAFILLSQNKSNAAAERQAKLDLQINLLAEQESTELLRVVILMAKKIGIDPKELRHAENLSDDTNPTDVLEKIVEKEKEDDK